MNYKTICQESENKQCTAADEVAHTLLPPAVGRTPAERAEIFNWALIPFPNGLTYKRIPRTLRDQASKQEREWGNRVIGKQNNSNWSGTMGELAVYEALMMKGKNPRKPSKRDHCEPDWETDECIYEVKTSNWTVPGTAGEKVLGTMYKYSDVPELYGKPLKIVCVAYQEWELTNGRTKIFGDISPRKQAYLDLAMSQGVEYVKFSDLVSGLNY